jgi:hypothetical protein
MLDRDGNAMREPGGQVRWQPLVTFIDALLSQYPDALDPTS